MGEASSRADAVLTALDPEQREVAATPTGPMCVLAGAGTGKTRAITHRIAYGVHSGAYVPQRVLAVTFTARAAGEMRTRLRELGVGGVPARTFHAAALRQLHFFWPQAVGGAAPEVLASKAPVVAESVSRLRMQFDRTAIRDLAAEIEWGKVSLLTPASYAAGARRAGREAPGIDHIAMARVWESYEERKTERGVIDFEDVLLLMAGILDERMDIARTVRDQYRHFVVDEYQDVNALQQRLLDLWLGGRDELCVVGDPAQTIYTFTGATPEHLLTFRTRYPQARLVRLVRNYRSTPQILRLANLVVSPARPILRRSGGGAVTAALDSVGLAAGKKLYVELFAVVDGGMVRASGLNVARSEGRCQQPGGNVESWRATGNEPGWLLAVGPEVVVLKRLGMPDVNVPGTTPTNENGGARFAANTEATRLAARFEPVVCHDTMADAVFGWTATVEVNGQTLKGCAWQR